MKVINFYGGPNTGKSTKAAGMYYKMNLAGYNVELVNEFAKELKISDFSVHIISSLTNIVNLLENLVGFTLWMPV